MSEAASVTAETAEASKGRLLRAFTQERRRWEEQLGEQKDAAGDRVHKLVGLIYCI